MFGILAGLGIRGAEAIGQAMQPKFGTQEYLVKKHGNTPDGLYMRALEKLTYDAYNHLPLTDAEIEAYNNAPCNKANGIKFTKRWS